MNSVTGREFLGFHRLPFLAPWFLLSKGTTILWTKSCNSSKPRRKLTFWLWYAWHVERSKWIRKYDNDFLGVRYSEKFSFGDLRTCRSYFLLVPDSAQNLLHTWVSNSKFTSMSQQNYPELPITKQILYTVYLCFLTWLLTVSNNAEAFGWCHSLLTNTVKVEPRKP